MERSNQNSKAEDNNTSLSFREEKIFLGFVREEMGKKYYDGLLEHGPVTMGRSRIITAVLQPL